MATSPTSQFRCPRCSKVLRPAHVWPIHCKCGELVYGTETPEPIAGGIACIHRGPAVRDLNCGCNGKPKVYQCKLGGECVLRYLPKMKPEERAILTNCLDCELREEPA